MTSSKGVAISTLTVLRFQSARCLLSTLSVFHGDLSIKIRMKWEWLVPLVEYTESWRQTRKLLDRSLRPGSMVAYRPLQLSKARILLAQLPTNPDEWEAHPEQFVIFYRRRY